MAPSSRTEPVTKHLTLHHFLKLQQRLKPAVQWNWQEVPAVGRQVPSEQLAVDDDDDGMGGAGPPRSYTCAFCRREFRSAQALGGDMNVHRRDRARIQGHGNGHGAGPTPAVTEYTVLYPY